MLSSSKKKATVDSKHWWESSIISMMVVIVAGNWAAYFLGQCNWKIAVGNTLLGIATGVRRVQTTKVIVMGNEGTNS